MKYLLFKGLCYTQSESGLMYRAEKKSLQILLSRTQAGPGRKVKQEQEEISRNHVPRLFLGSVHYLAFCFPGPLTCAEENKGLTAIAVDNVTLDLSGGSLACREHCAQGGDTKEQ